MKYLGVLSLLTIASADTIFDTKLNAKSVLARQRRDNAGIFEEALGGNLQRECVEEMCSYDEVLEIFDSEAEAATWWADATKQCSKADACDATGTKTCINRWMDHECVCHRGWQNTDDKADCSTDIDECEEEGFCKNAGDCTNTAGGFDCACVEGWGGDQCETDINECESENNPCLNGAMCINSEGSYSCECTAQWEGENCEIDINECDVDTEICKNGGGCINHSGGYECLCNGGWTGNTCEDDFDECADNPCPFGSTCQSDAGMNSFVCVCPDRGCNNLNETEYLIKSEEAEREAAPDPTVAVYEDTTYEEISSSNSTEADEDYYPEESTDDYASEAAEAVEDTYSEDNYFAENTDDYGDSESTEEASDYETAETTNDYETYIDVTVDEEENTPVTYDYAVEADDTYSDGY